MVSLLSARSIFGTANFINLFVSAGLRNTEEDELLDELIPHALAKRRFPSHPSLKPVRRQFVSQIEDFVPNVQQPGMLAMPTSDLTQAINSQTIPEVANQNVQALNLQTVQNVNNQQTDMGNNQGYVEVGSDGNKEEVTETSIPGNGYEVTTNAEKNAEKVKNDVKNYGLWEYGVDNTGAGVNELAKLLPVGGALQSQGSKEKSNAAVITEEQLTGIGNTAEQLLGGPQNALNYSPTPTKGLDGGGNIEGLDKASQTALQTESDGNLGPGVSVVTIPNSFSSIEDEKGNNLAGILGTQNARNSPRPTSAMQILKALLRKKLGAQAGNSLTGSMLGQGNKWKKITSGAALSKLLAAFRNSQQVKATGKPLSGTDNGEQTKINNNYHIMVSGALGKQNHNGDIKNNEKGKNNAEEKMSDTDLKLLHYVKNLMQQHRQSHTNKLLKAPQKVKVSQDDSPTSEILKVLQQSLKSDEKSDSTGASNGETYELQSVLKEFQEPSKPKDSMFDDPDQPLGSPLADGRDSDLMKYLEHETALVDNFQEGSQISDPNKQLKNLAEVLLKISRKHNMEDAYGTTSRPYQTGGTAKSNMADGISEEDKQKWLDDYSKSEPTNTAEPVQNTDIKKDGNNTKDQTKDPKVEESKSKDKETITTAEVKVGEAEVKTKDDVKDKTSSKEGNQEDKESKEKEKTSETHSNEKEEVSEKQNEKAVEDRKENKDDKVKSMSKEIKVELDSLQDHKKKVEKQHDQDTKDNADDTGKDKKEEKQFTVIKEDKNSEDSNKEDRQSDKKEDRLKDDTERKQATESDVNNSKSDSKQQSDTKIGQAENKTDTESVKNADSKEASNHDSNTVIKLKENTKDQDSSVDQKEREENGKVVKVGAKGKVQEEKAAGQDQDENFDNEKVRNQDDKFSSKDKDLKTENNSLRAQDKNLKEQEDKTNDQERLEHNVSENNKDGKSYDSHKSSSVLNDNAVEDHKSTSSLNEVNNKDAPEVHGHFHSVDKIKDLKVQAQESHQDGQGRSSAENTGHRQGNKSNSSQMDPHKPTAGLPFLNPGKAHQQDVDNDPGLKEYLQQKGLKKNFHRHPTGRYFKVLPFTSSRLSKQEFAKDRDKDNTDRMIDDTKGIEKEMSEENAKVMSRIPTISGTRKVIEENAEVMSQIPTAAITKNRKLLNQLRQRLNLFYYNPRNKLKFLKLGKPQTHLVPPAGQGVPFNPSNVKSSMQFQNDAENKSDSVKTHHQEKTVAVSKFNSLHKPVSADVLQRLLSLHLKNYALSKPINLAPLAQLIALAKARQRMVDVTAAKKSLTDLVKGTQEQQQVDNLARGAYEQSQMNLRASEQLKRYSKLGAGQFQTEPIQSTNTREGSPIINPAGEGELSILQANISTESKKKSTSMLPSKDQFSLGQNTLMSDAMSRMFTESKSSIESKQDNGVDPSDITRSNVMSARPKLPDLNINTAMKLLGNKDNTQELKSEVLSNFAKTTGNSKFSVHFQSAKNQLGHYDEQTKRNKNVSPLINSEPTKHSVVIGEPLLRSRHILPFHRQEAAKTFVRRKDVRDIIRKLRNDRNISNFILRRRNEIPKRPNTPILVKVT